MHEGGVARQRLVEAGSDTAASLEGVETALDEVALAVQLLVEPSLLLLPFRPVGDHRLDVASLQSLDNRVGVVSCICKTNSAWQVVKELLC